MNYVFYTQHGEIYRTISCTESDLCLNVRLGDLYLACDATFNDYIDNGQVKPKGPQPSPQHTFNYTTKQWEPDPVMAEDQARAKRATLLQESDWAALPDVPMTPEERVLWAAYRQGLRDVTVQAGYPLNVVWPVKP